MAFTAAPTWAPRWPPTCTRPSCSTCAATNGRSPPTTCCGAEPSWACATAPRNARPWPTGWPPRAEAPATAALGSALFARHQEVAARIGHRPLRVVLPDRHLGQRHAVALAHRGALREG